MKELSDAEMKQALAARLDFYRELGIRDFYLRPLPSGEELDQEASESNSVTTTASMGSPQSEVVDPRAALAAIREDLGDCTRCPLHKLGRKQIVFGVGNPNADI